MTEVAPLGKAADPAVPVGHASTTAHGQRRAEGPGPTVAQVLHAAVGRLGGEDRPGQLEMAEAVGAAMRTGRHLLVQAGTGTGKSLAYLVPAVMHGRRVVVATATLALQHQLVERDIPALLEAGSDVLGARPSYAVLKGRSNYACLHRIREGVPDDQGALVEVPVGTMAAEVLRLREWAEDASVSGGTGDRDSAPAHADRLWQQVSVSHRECLGATKCPYGIECFAERARERAMAARLVVTNHSLLAIDAIEQVPMLPDYDVVVVDEAHELAARVTQAATDELTVAAIERAARRAGNFLDPSEADEVTEAAAGLRAALDALVPGRLDTVPEALSTALSVVASSTRAALSAFPRESGDAEANAARQQARGMVDEIRKVAERLAAHAETDVTWVAQRVRGGSHLRVAPLQVWSPLRHKLLSRKTVIFTSATLKLGGDFTAIATSIGLLPSERVDQPGDVAVDREAPHRDTAAVDLPDKAARDDAADASAADGAPTVPADVSPGGGPVMQGNARAAADASPADASSGSTDPADTVERDDEPEVLPWRAIDVGSPFDYPSQAILYVAKHLPVPGRDGIASAQIDEITSLLEAAGGRTLGLFSSRRAAVAACEAVRAALPHMPVLCQGDGQLSHLQTEFLANPAVSLFGTLSLWQGLDVPGDTCQLVIIDRIPFPRPDDPLMSARSRAAERAGGNGFMAVSATSAALLLAQGSGRLIRSRADRGVVAVLDPRLSTARYGPFLRASLPAMWMTSDGEVVRSALRRLDTTAKRQRRPTG
jgi:ATP-dependent DNA helicase DinG